MLKDYEVTPMQRFQPSLSPCSAKWQERNAALEEVSNILKGAGGHVQPSIGNLLSLLKVGMQYAQAVAEINLTIYSY